MLLHTDMLYIRMSFNVINFCSNTKHFNIRVQILFNFENQVYFPSNPHQYKTNKICFGVNKHEPLN